LPPEKAASCFEGFSEIFTIVHTISLPSTIFAENRMRLGKR